MRENARRVPEGGGAMNLLFLGSAASEAIPALWCECPNCRKAAALGGRNLRRRTS